MADRDSANRTDTNRTTPTTNQTPSGSTGTGGGTTGSTGRGDSGSAGATGSSTSGGSSGTGGDFASEFEALKTDLAQVRRDLASLADLGYESVTSGAGSARDRAKGMSGHAKGMADSMTDGAKDVAGRVRDVSSSAMQTEQEMMDEVRARVGDHPLTSVAVAMSTGFLVGWIVSRR